MEMTWESLRFFWPLQVMMGLGPPPGLQGLQPMERELWGAGVMLGDGTIMFSGVQTREDKS